MTIVPALSQLADPPIPPQETGTAYPEQVGVTAVTAGAGGIRLLAGGEFVELVRGHALIADSVVASVAVPETPTVQIWPNVSAADTHYNSATGVIEFEESGFFTSVATWRVIGQSSQQFYSDAEFSLDGGRRWLRGTNSLREVVVSALAQTVSFPFSGHFAAGVRLRFVFWASGPGVTLQTATASASTAPASRLTYSHIVGVKDIA
jgi:hypothetical protein